MFACGTPLQTQINTVPILLCKLFFGGGFLE